MTVVEAPVLRDFYDPAQVSEDEVAAELARLNEETAVEREWIEQSGMQPFSTDRQLQQAFGRVLDKVEPGVGMTPIWKLRDWDSESTYSPPYLRPRALQVAKYIGLQWSEEERFDEVGEWSLSFTSFVRSTRYQTDLRPSSEKETDTSKTRKVAVDPREGKHSSHEYGLAFDVDGCGLYLLTDGEFKGFHPRMDHEHHEKIEQSRETLKTILNPLKVAGLVNIVEEVPGTKQWCFHICVNPLVPPDQILRSTPLR